MEYNKIIKNHLSEPEYLRFLHNRKSGRFLSKGIKYSAVNIINFAFAWDTTPEGYTYWLDIYIKLGD